jgi:Cu/Ag efflux protein CusF
MKTKLAILLVILCFINSPVCAQEKTKKELKAEKNLQKQKEIEALIDAKKFDFEAQKLTPQGGRLINLDYNTYFLKFDTEKTTAD